MLWWAFWKPWGWQIRIKCQFLSAVLMLKCFHVTILVRLKASEKFASRWSAGKPWSAATRLPVVELPWCHICWPAVCHKTCAECHVLSCRMPWDLCLVRAILSLWHLTICGSFLPSSALTYNPGKQWKQTNTVSSSWKKRTGHNRALVDVCQKKLSRRKDKKEEFTVASSKFDYQQLIGSLNSCCSSHQHELLPACHRLLELNFRPGWHCWCLRPQQSDDWVLGQIPRAWPRDGGGDLPRGIHQSPSRAQEWWPSPRWWNQTWRSQWRKHKRSWCSHLDRSLPASSVYFAFVTMRTLCTMCTYTYLDCINGIDLWDSVWKRWACITLCCSLIN